MSDRVYGGAVVTDYMRHHGIEPGVIGTVATSPAGNLVLRIGHTTDADTWTQTEHVVLTPDEARALVVDIQEAMRAAGVVL